MEKAFKITSVSRLDIDEVMDDREFAESLTDDEMYWISRKLADAYCEYMFWDSLKALCDDVKDQRKRK